MNNVRTVLAACLTTVSFVSLAGCDTEGDSWEGDSWPDAAGPDVEQQSRDALTEYIGTEVTTSKPDTSCTTYPNAECCLTSANGSYCQICQSTQGCGYLVCVGPGHDGVSDTWGDCW